MDATAERPNLAVDEGLAADALFSTLYAELHRLARREVNRRGSLGGLGVTTVLHVEAYRLFRRGRRRVRRSRALHGVRRPGDARAESSMTCVAPSEYRQARRRFRHHGARHAGTNRRRVLRARSIGDALDELAQVEPMPAEIIELKFFCGFSFIEIAAMRGVSEQTFQRGWEKARLSYTARSRARMIS